MTTSQEPGPAVDHDVHNIPSYDLLNDQAGRLYKSSVGFFLIRAAMSLVFVPISFQHDRSLQVKGLVS